MPLRPKAGVAAAIATLALLPAAGCGGGDDDSGGGGGEPRDARTTFADTCGGCHTLAAADTGGQVGPNLDDLGPDRQRVLNAIRTGPGAMPPNLLSGAEAAAVAVFVSGNAGN